MTESHRADGCDYPLDHNRKVLPNKASSTSDSGLMADAKTWRSDPINGYETAMAVLPHT
jgi:hypothetical protein